MKKLDYLLISILFPLILSSVEKEDILKQAWEKIQRVDYISYTSIRYWPNPAGIIDTTQQETAFLRKDRTYFSYDYITKQAAYDVAYSNNRYMMVDHGDSIISAYSKEDMEKYQRRIVESTTIMFSPITFLDPEENSWQYVQDTVLENKVRQQFYQVEMDTVIEGNAIYVEQHIFLDESSSLLTEFERRAYNQNQLSQKISIQYSNYTLEKSDQEYLVYNPPTDYVTRIYGERKKLTLIGEDTVAPAFSLPDLEGNQIATEKLTGKYVLLDFSVINCGWCKKALDQFNQEDFKLSENIVGLYLNPDDDPEQIKNYQEKIPIPFSVIDNAVSISRAFGISAFPSFVLIDPEGDIEKVVEGYDEDFTKSLQSL